MFLDPCKTGFRIVKAFDSGSTTVTDTFLSCKNSSVVDAKSSTEIGGVTGFTVLGFKSDGGAASDDGVGGTRAHCCYFGAL